VWHRVGDDDLLQADKKESLSGDSTDRREQPPLWTQGTEAQRE